MTAPAPLLPIPEAQKIFDAAFRGIDGYAAARRAVARITALDDSFTYGEITFAAMQKLLAALPPTHGVFYDLGSGIGAAVIAAALLGNFSRLIGVEILDELHAAAELARRRLVIELELHLPRGAARPQISFLQRDLFTIDFSDADVVFISSTCFTDTMMSMLRRRLTMLRPGSTIVTMTRTLQSTVFELTTHFIAPMNWGEAGLFIYKKL